MSFSSIKRITWLFFRPMSLYMQLNKSVYLKYPNLVEIKRISAQTTEFYQHGPSHNPYFKSETKRCYTGTLSIYFF